MKFTITKTALKCYTALVVWWEIYKYVRWTKLYTFLISKNASLFHCHIFSKIELFSLRTVFTIACEVVDKIVQTKQKLKLLYNPSQNSRIWNFIKIGLSVLKLFLTFERTDGTPQGCERAQRHSHVNKQNKLWSVYLLLIFLDLVTVHFVSTHISINTFWTWSK